MFFKLQHASDSPRRLVEIRYCVPPPEFLGSRSGVVFWEFAFLRSFQGNVDTAGLGEHTLRSTYVDDLKLLKEKSASLPNEADSFDVCYGKIMSWHFRMNLREVQIILGTMLLM